MQCDFCFQVMPLNLQKQVRCYGKKSLTAKESSGHPAKATEEPSKLHLGGAGSTYSNLHQPFYCTVKSIKHKDRFKFWL